jgi:hypothetical protein
MGAALPAYSNTQIARKLFVTKTLRLVHFCSWGRGQTRREIIDYVSRAQTGTRGDVKWRCFRRRPRSKRPRKPP